MKGWFDEHNVDVVANSNITKVEPNVLYNHEETIPVDAVVWTAGIRPVAPVRNIDTEKDRFWSSCIKYSIINFLNINDVYVVGDCAALPYAPSAQVAEEQAEQIVKVYCVTFGTTNHFLKKCRKSS